MNIDEYGKTAKDNFKSGANCAQSVLSSFSDAVNLDSETLMKLGSAFGGGFAKMREVCGAVTGMLMIQGLICGYTLTTGNKRKTYHDARELMDEFKTQNGSIICRELLHIRGVNAEPGGDPSARTEEYYHKRSCADYCESAAKILGKYLSELNR